MDPELFFFLPFFLSFLASPRTRGAIEDNGGSIRNIYDWPTKILNHRKHWRRSSTIVKLSSWWRELLYVVWVNYSSWCFSIGDNIAVAPIYVWQSFQSWTYRSTKGLCMELSLQLVSKPFFFWTKYQTPQEKFVAILGEMCIGSPRSRGAVGWCTGYHEAGGRGCGPKYRIMVSSPREVPKYQSEATNDIHETHEHPSMYIMNSQNKILLYQSP